MMISRAKKLAGRVEKAHHQLMNFIETCSQEDWEVMIPDEKRTVGVVVHHIASILPDEVKMLTTLASGHPVTGLTKVLLDEINARHARENANCTRQEAMTLLRRNSIAAVETIREMSDNELNSASTVSLHWQAPLTAQYIIEEHPLVHTYRHLSGIVSVLGREDY